MLFGHVGDSSMIELESKRPCEVVDVARVADRVTELT